MCSYLTYTRTAKCMQHRIPGSGGDGGSAGELEPRTRLSLCLFLRVSLCRCKSGDGELVSCRMSVCLSVSLACTSWCGGGD